MRQRTNRGRTSRAVSRDRLQTPTAGTRALGTLAPERLAALRRVATIESIGSSTRIEDSKLSDREVERLLSNLEFKSFATRDEQEVAGYAELMDLVFSSWKDIPFTENHIKQLHQILLCYSEKDTWHRGNYKTNSNSIAARLRIEPALKGPLLDQLTEKWSTLEASLGATFVARARSIWPTESVEAEFMILCEWIGMRGVYRCEEMEGT